MCSGVKVMRNSTIDCGKTIGNASRTVGQPEERIMIFESVVYCK